MARDAVPTYIDGTPVRPRDKVWWARADPPGLLEAKVFKVGRDGLVTIRLPDHEIPDKRTRIRVRPRDLIRR